MFEDVKNKLEGCIYTIFTPFTKVGEIDYEALERYLTYLYRGGARKFYAMAYNSRYSQLEQHEILELNEYCVQLLKRLDPSNLVIVGDPIHCSTKTSINFVKHAKEIKADLISLIVREKYFYDEQIVEHYAEIGRACNFPQLVHEMPFLSGMDGKQMHWPRSLFDKLNQVPQIAALKEDAKEFEITKHALSLEPAIRVVIAGFKDNLLQYLAHGAKAYLNGISIIDAQIGERFWKAVREDDQKFIRRIIDEVESPFVEKLVRRYGWHRVNKAILQAAGFMGRWERRPMPHLPDADFAIVETVYQEIFQNFKRIQNESTN